MNADTLFEGRGAVVTGASSGIGRALAVALAARGAGVVLGGRDVRELGSTLDAIRIAGGRAVACPGDVRTGAHLERLREAAFEEFGALDVWANAAGSGYQGPIATGRIEEWREMVETNLLAVCMASREAIRSFGPKGGHLINFSSAAVDTLSPGQAVYGATKQAVESFTRSLAKELEGQPLHVILVRPEPVLTRIGRNLQEPERRRVARSLGVSPDAVREILDGRASEADLHRLQRELPGIFLRAGTVAERVVAALAFPPPSGLTCIDVHLALPSHRDEQT